MDFSLIGQAIKHRRTALGITRPKLAELAGVNRNTLYQLENGLTNPSLGVLMKVTDVLGMEIKIEVKNKA
jgi:transcriptional regulator with XRE-family HTH domain